MGTKRFDAAMPELAALYEEAAAADVQPLWELKGLLTPQPRPTTVPFRWHVAELLKLGERAIELVPIDRGGDRRALALCNPGLQGKPYVANSLWAALQFLAPGEVAPAHRHSPAALRYILEGTGVWTLVNGDPLRMSRGDLILTPSMAFHEHHNPSDTAMVWLDVLDLPLAEFLEAIFFERGPSEEVDSRTDLSSRSEQIFGHAGIVPTHALGAATDPHSPLLAYRWVDTDAALTSAMKADGLDAASVRFLDPLTNRDVMPTLRCEMRRVAAGATIPAERQTGSRVCAVLNGSGTATVGDQTYDLVEGDVYVIPSWATHRLEAGPGADIDVFVTSDAPVLECLHLYREEIEG